MAVIAVPDTPLITVSQTPVRSVRLTGARWMRVLLAAFLVPVLCASLIYADVRLRHNAIYTNNRDVPAAPVAIVFGAGYNRRGLSPILADRVTTGVALYKAGKVRRLLLTGDNGAVTHNEPEAMCQFALKMGVPRRAIMLDYAGFRTYDSLYRARHTFGVHRAILVTQAYHLPRALYTARALGLDAWGVCADRRDYGSAMPRYELREILAALNAWFEVNISHPLPRIGNREQEIGNRGDALSPSE